MIQQTALILVAGLVFLFFFAPNSSQAINLTLAIPLLVILTFMPALLLYFFGRRAINRLEFSRERRIKQLRNSKIYTFVFGIVVLAGFVFEIYYLQLPVLVEKALSFWKFRNSRTLIGIVPLVIAILLIRLATFELDRQVRNTSWTKRKYLLLNLKLMLLPLAPFIIYLLIGDIIDHAPLNVRIFFIVHPYLYWAIMLSIIAIMYIQSPSFIRRIWETRPLPDGELRSKIEDMAKKENIRYKDVLVWNTAGGKIANAGMAGLLPISRYVFLTKTLLADFSSDEIETVVAHEFGHIKHKHMLSYLVISLGYMVFYAFLYIQIMPTIERINLSGNMLAFFSAGVTLIAFYIYFIFIFRFLSRRFERQADLYAVDSTGKPEVFKSALVRLGHINYSPSRISRLIEIIRTHPSISRRLEFIDRAEWGYADAEKYRRPVFHLGRVSVLILLALALLFVTNKEIFIPSGDIHYEIGRQYAAEGMIDRAILEFKEAKRIDPKGEHIHYALGILYDKKGQTKKSIEELEITLKINPKNDSARKKLGQIIDR